MPRRTMTSAPGDALRIEHGIVVSCRRTETKITVPDGAVGILPGAFRRSAVQEVILPPSVRWIGAGAFESCRHLTRLVLPEGLVRIPGRMCSECTGLRHIHLPDTVESIGPKAFACAGLETVDLPGSVRVLEVRSFQKTQIRSVTFHEGLVLIGVAAFEGCRFLSDVALPESLRMLCLSAFSECAALRSVRFREGLLALGGFPFHSCPELQVLHLPASLEAASSVADGIPNLSRILFTGRGTHFSTAGFLRPSLLVDAPHMEPDLIPEDLRPAAAAAFLERIRRGNSPDPIVQMAWDFTLSHTWTCCEDSMCMRHPGGYGFPTILQYMVERRIMPEREADRFWEKCRSSGLQTGDPALFQPPPDPNKAEDPDLWEILNHVVHSYRGKDPAVRIPDGVTGIAHWAFLDGTVEEIWIPDSVEWIGKGAFDGCTSLQSVRLPAGLRMIRGWLFSGCTALEEILLPEGLEIIDRFAFQKSGLREIALPDSLLHIGIEAFLCCGSLERVRFGKNLRCIESRAFQECTALREVNLPGSLISLGDSCFESCGNLEHIDLPEGLRTIGEQTFENCSSLQELTIPATVDMVSGFDGCDSMERLVLPGGIAFHPGVLASGAPPVLAAPAADPDWLRGCPIDALLRGFARHRDDCRYPDRYRQMLQKERQRVWTDPACFHLLLENCMLEREDIQPCLEALHQADQPVLVAELLEYQHLRFPPEDDLLSCREEDLLPSLREDS